MSGISSTSQIIAICQVQEPKQTRRRPHPASSWARIKPILQDYYIDQDLTLQDSMRRIEQEHDFYATEQMYKKRLKAWGLSKQIKSVEKEKALAKLLANEPITEEALLVRPDKLVRYAKSRIKSRIVPIPDWGRRPRPEADVHRLDLDSAGRLERKSQLYRSRSIIVPSLISLDDETHCLDLFLRAMQVLIIKEREEWSLHPNQAPDMIHSALIEGVELWQKNQFTAARKRLGQAARQTTADLQSPTSPVVSRITFCISSIIWDAERTLMLQKFTEFLVKAAREHLDKSSPLNMVLQFFCREHSLDAQLRIWMAAMNGLQLSELNFRHWWNMARRRWRWCHRNGLWELAESYRDQAVAQIWEIGKLTAEMKREAQGDFDVPITSILNCKSLVPD